MPRKKKGKINSTSKTYKGIKYKSLLEMDFAKKADKAGIPFEYEKKSFTLLDKITLEFGEYYGKWGKNFIKRTPDVDNLTYTPDFIYDTGSVFVVVETKGHANESYPLRRKLFFHYMERSCNKYIFFEPRTNTDNTAVIEIVKTLINNTRK